MKILFKFSYYLFFSTFSRKLKKTSNSSIKYQQTDKADTDAKIKKKQIVVFKNHKLIPLIKFDEKFLNYINFLA